VWLILTARRPHRYGRGVRDQRTKLCHSRRQLRSVVWGGLGVRHRRREGVSRHSSVLSPTAVFPNDQMTWLLSLICAVCRMPWSACMHICFSVSVTAICDSCLGYCTTSVGHDIIKRSILRYHLIDMNTRRTASEMTTDMCTLWFSGPKQLTVPSQWCNLQNFLDPWTDSGFIASYCTRKAEDVPTQTDSIPPISCRRVNILISARGQRGIARWLKSTEMLFSMCYWPCTCTVNNIFCTTLAHCVHLHGG